MTRAVWKYELDLTDGPQLRPMPRCALVVHVAAQGDAPCVWAEVDPSLTLVDRTFVVHGTGHPVDHDGRHVGSALTHGGSLVWHVYEVAS